MKKLATVAAMLLGLLALDAVPSGGDRMPLTTSSDEARGLYEQARHLMDSLQRDKARPLLEQAVKLDPDFALAHLLLAGTQIRGSDFRAVMDSSADCTAGRTTTRRSGTSAAPWKRARAGHPGTTRSATPTRVSVATPRRPPRSRRPSRSSPTTRTATDSYGELLLRMGRFDEAIASYERVLEMEPLFPSAHMGIASGLLHLERHEDARARLREIDAVAPHDGIRAGMCWALAVTWIDEGNVDAALEELERNLRYSRNLEAAGRIGGDLYTIARVLLHAGRVDEAERRFAESVVVARDNAGDEERALKFVEVRAEQSAVLVATQRGDSEAARRHAARYEELSGELNAPFMIPFLHTLRGEIALAEGDAEGALAELRQGDTTDVMTMYRIAQAYEKKGDRSSARDWYGYVATYRGSLNLDYSMVRHDAAKRLSAL